MKKFLMIFALFIMFASSNCKDHSFDNTGCRNSEQKMADDVLIRARMRSIKLLVADLKEETLSAFNLERKDVIVSQGESTGSGKDNSYWVYDYHGIENFSINKVDEIVRNLNKSAGRQIDGAKFYFKVRDSNKNIVEYRLEVPLLGSDYYE